MRTIYLIEFRFRNGQDWQLLTENEGGVTVIFFEEENAEAERDRLKQEGDLKGAQIRVVSYVQDWMPAQRKCDCGDTFPTGEGYHGHCCMRCHDHFWGGETEADFVEPEPEEVEV